MGTWCLVIALLINAGISALAAGTLSIDPLPQVVFAGGTRTIYSSFRNQTGRAVTLDLTSRLFQASSATLMPVSESRPSRAISLAAGQVVIEPAEVAIPAVTAETRFLLQWSDGANKIGATLIRAVPTDILSKIAALNGGPVAIVDPDAAITPAFKASELVSLANVDELGAYDRKLLICAIAAGKELVPGLAAAAKKKAGQGGAVVWLQSGSDRGSSPGGSFNTVPSNGSFSPVCHLLDVGEGHLAISRALDVRGLSNSPAIQLALIELAELALGVRKLELPADLQP